MSVRFFGPLNLNTGYGNAVMNFAKAFSESDIKTKFILPGNSGQKLIKNLNNHEGSTNTDFYLHCPPYNKHQSKATKKIGYFYWEADRLPRHWMRSIHEVNELWVPCELVRDACIKARFKGPIKIVPTPCNEWLTDKKIEIPAMYSSKEVLSSSVYKFYSIFQWQPRKGFDILLNSYFSSFNENDEVILILKVNPLNMPGFEKEDIRKDIIDIKNKLNLKYYPPIYLSDVLVDIEDIHSLHNSADCYVSPHHGEGWGMPIHDAMRMSKQLIITKYGGVTEYLDNDSSNIIKHTLGPVSGMEWSSLYGSYQNWAHPSMNHLSKLFRDVYENHKQYQYKQDNVKKIADTMTISNIAKIINKELS